MLHNECVSHSNRGKAGLLLKTEDAGLCQLWRQGTSSERLELLRVQHCFLLPLVGAPHYSWRFRLYSPNRPSDLAGLASSHESRCEHVTQACPIRGESCDTDQFFCFGYSRIEEPIFL